MGQTDVPKRPRSQRDEDAAHPELARDEAEDKEDPEREVREPRGYAGRTHARHARGGSGGVSNARARLHRLGAGRLGHGAGLLLRTLLQKSLPSHVENRPAAPTLL